MECYGEYNQDNDDISDSDHELDDFDVDDDVHLAGQGASLHAMKELLGRAWKILIFITGFFLLHFLHFLGTIISVLPSFFSSWKNAVLILCIVY